MWTFLKRLFGISALPARYTYDMTIPLPPGRTIGDFVEFVIESALRGVPDDETERAMVEEFQVPPKDAELVRDRVFGGIVRAGTRCLANRPCPTHDPFALASFERASKDLSIFERIYPQFVKQDVRNT